MSRAENIFYSILTVSALGLAIFYLIAPKATIAPSETSSAFLPHATEYIDPASLSLYSSGAHGFSFAYPGMGILTDEPEAIAAAVADNPRWYSAATVLIITLPDASLAVSIEKLAAGAYCTRTLPGEESLGVQEIGNNIWNVFSRSDIGTDSPTQGFAYRTLHPGSCTMIIARQPMSLDEPALRNDLLQAIRSFSFAPHE